MNFKGIKRAEELRLNIERQDKEIIELERIMLNLALTDGQGLTMSLSVTDPLAGTGRNVKAGKGYEPGGLPTKSIDTPFGSMTVFDVASRTGGMEGIFKSIQEAAGNMEHLLDPSDRTVQKPIKGTFILTNAMALEFLTIHHQRLTDERALAFKLLEECIKSLKVLD